MKTTHQTARGAFLILAIFCGAHADDVPREAAPLPFTARFKLLEPAAVAHPVARRADLALPSAGVLSQLPELQVKTAGPTSLIVNEAAEYRVELKNLGTRNAQGVQVKCPLPRWVEISRHQSSTGSVNRQRGEVVWTVPNLAGSATQYLTLQVTPREGQAFDLRFSVAVQPTDVGKRITVQQPQLDLQIADTTELAFDELTTINLTLENAGTGPLRDIDLELFAGSRSLHTRSVIELKAGETQVVPVEVNATQAGQHVLRVAAKAGSGYADTVEAQFVVKRGELEVEVQGAPNGYAGQLSKYRVHVTNIGNAPVHNVLLSLDLPSSMKYRGGLPAANQTDGGVSWVVNRVAPGEKLSFPVDIIADQGGPHTMTAHAHTLDRQNAMDDFVAEMQTAPDLKLVVVDPVGPQALDGPFDYHVEVINHGTDVAKDVSVTALVGDGCEVVDVSGTAVIKDGRVYFQPQAKLTAKRKLVYKIRVQPKLAGTHEFRVLVKSDAPETRLATQETTRVVERRTHPKSSVENERLASRTLLDLSAAGDSAKPTLANPPTTGESALR